MNVSLMKNSKFFGKSHSTESAASDRRSSSRGGSGGGRRSRDRRSSVVAAAAAVAALHIGTSTAAMDNAAREDGSYRKRAGTAASEVVEVVEANEDGTEDKVVLLGSVESCGLEGSSWSNFLIAPQKNKSTKFSKFLSFLFFFFLMCVCVIESLSLPAYVRILAWVGHLITFSCDLKTPGGSGDRNFCVLLIPLPF